MFMGLYNDDVRYKEVYWSKFPGIYYPGDYAIKDNDGYFWLLGKIRFLDFFFFSRDNS